MSKWLVSVGYGWLLLTFEASAQEALTPTPQVLVYSTHFVADEMQFQSVEELRTYLLDASHEFYNIGVRDCAAKDRVEELARVMTEVIAERAARRNQDVFVYQFGIGWPEGCAPQRRR